MNNNTVCFYKYSNYEGEKLCLTAGQYSNLDIIGWNDTISSIHIPEGFTVNVHTIKNFAGISQTFTSIDDLTNLSTYDLNNKISSVQIVESGLTGYQTCLYMDCHFNSDFVCLYPGDYPYPVQFGGFPDNSIRSIKLGIGHQITVWTSYDFTGDMVTYTTSQECLITNVSSFQIQNTINIEIIQEAVPQKQFFTTLTENKEIIPHLISTVYSISLYCALLICFLIIIGLIYMIISNQTKG
jgi:hypothetical protein